MLHSRFIDPYGGKLRSFERNLIRYRTTQIALLLFYAEELKYLIVESIRSTDSIYGKLKGDTVQERLPPETKRLTEKALKILLRDGVLSVSEAEDCKNIFASRNNAAHEIHELLADLSNVTFARRYSEYSARKYDYDAADKAKKYIELLWQRLADKGYVSPLA